MLGRSTAGALLLVLALGLPGGSALGVPGAGVRALGVPAAAGAAGVLAPPVVAEDVDCLGVAEGDPRPATEQVSEPLEAIGVPGAQAWLRRTGRAEAGAGVTVAVLSSGISERAGLPLAPGGTSVVGPGPVVDPTGTVVAGLVAGPPRAGDLGVGVAPAAEVVDVRVHGTATPTGEGRQPTVEALAAGLVHVRDQAGPVDVVVVPLQVPRDERVTSLVEDLLERGVLVVAQAGDRPPDLAEDGAAEPGSLAGLALARPDEDAGPLVHPAGIAGVVAVGPLPEEVDAALRSSALDLVAPSRRAVSVSLEGGTCVVQDAVSAWPTGLVAGVLALLRSAYPDAAPEELRARLVATADGRPDVPSPLTGAGQVQALDALTATAGDLRAGGYAGDTRLRPPATAATVPEPPEDPLAATRGRAAWWGLLGGGALLLAVLVRPLRARRP